MFSYRTMCFERKLKRIKYVSLLILEKNHRRYEIIIVATNTDNFTSKRKLEF